MKHFLFIAYTLIYSFTAFDTLAGPACNTKEERHLVLTTEMIDGYRFDMFSPGITAEAQPNDASNIPFYGEACSEDTFLIVTHNVNPIFMSRSAPYTASSYRLAQPEDYREGFKMPDNASVGIYEYTGGGTCCGYIHLFQTQPKFKYLGEVDAKY